MPPWVLLRPPLRTRPRGCCWVQGEEGAGGASSGEQTWARPRHHNVLTSEQITTNHCTLKAGERQPAERAASNEMGKDDADKQRTSKEEEDYDNKQGRGLCRCRHCCCYRCHHRMPPHQLCRYCLCSSSGSVAAAVVACGGAW
jgi:hypothetical protein